MGTYKLNSKCQSSINISASFKIYKNGTLIYPIDFSKIISSANVAAINLAQVVQNPAPATDPRCLATSEAILATHHLPKARDEAMQIRRIIEIGELRNNTITDQLKEMANEVTIFLGVVETNTGNAGISKGPREWENGMASRVIDGTLRVMADPDEARDLCQRLEEYAEKCTQVFE